MLTLINVFSVVPEKQDELTNLLIKAIEETMRPLPGFISAKLHKSHDGRRVVNYAQWRSREDFEMMLKNPQTTQQMANIARLAEFDRILCEVAHSSTG